MEMKTTLLTLPIELRLSILQYLTPFELDTSIKLICKQLQKESQDNVLWGFRLDKKVRPPHYPDSKKRFFDHFEDVLEEERDSHPLGALYNELLSIEQSSDLSCNKKSKQFRDKALKNRKAGYVLFLIPIFWHSIFFTKEWNPFYDEWIIDIARSSPEAACLLLENDELVEAVLRINYGERRTIAFIAQSSPEAACLFLRKKELFDCENVRRDGNAHIIDVAKVCPEAACLLLENDELMEAMSKHYYESIPWIPEVEKIAALHPKMNR